MNQPFDPCPRCRAAQINRALNKQWRFPVLKRARKLKRPFGWALLRAIVMGER